MHRDEVIDLDAPATYGYVRFRFRLLIWLPLFTLAAFLTFTQTWFTSSDSNLPGDKTFAEMWLFCAIPFLAFGVAEGTKRTCFLALVATSIPLLIELHLLYVVLSSADLNPTGDFAKALLASATLVAACAIATRNAPRGAPAEIGKLRPDYSTNPDL